MKKAKSIWTMVALTMGLGVGFTVAFAPAPAEAWPGDTVECTRDSDCDARCDGPGSGDCSAWKCYCLR
jgi:hypothetical protein